MPEWVSVAGEFIAVLIWACVAYVALRRKVGRSVRRAADDLAKACGTWAEGVQRDAVRVRQLSAESAAALGRIAEMSFAGVDGLVAILLARGLLPPDDVVALRLRIQEAQRQVGRDFARAAAVLSEPAKAGPAGDV